MATQDFPLIHTRVRDLAREATNLKIKVDILDLTVRYGAKAAIDRVSLASNENVITAIIGPSGCGKSTLLRAVNRMNDTIPGVKTTGKIWLDGKNIYDAGVDLITLRQRVGMVFQQPNPFSKSIYDNVAYGLRINGMVRSRADLDERIERALKAAALWEEVQDVLGRNALQLSGGQQQRLCIARALAVEPDVLLMDEPASALDPISTAKIEELMIELKKNYTIVIVTHNLQQAARVSDFTAFLLNGTLVEMNPTAQIFTNPSDERTEAYITGRFG